MYLIPWSTVNVYAMAFKGCSVRTELIEVLECTFSKGPQSAATSYREQIFFIIVKWALNNYCLVVDRCVVCCGN
jgi:hypothetical protein